jgi:hypothetical protein
MDVKPSNSPIRHARSDGAVEGIRTHLPAAVGVVLTGTIGCGLAAFAHFVLGLPVTAATIGALATSATARRGSRSIRL